MVTRADFYLPSSDGRSKIHGVHWTPDGGVRVILVIVHGMAEHIGRYDEFARFLASEGIAVAGHDHLGHGRTSRPEDYGYFADGEGDRCVLEDMHCVAQHCRGLYPGVPIIMLGHSMGSFFLRRYVTIYEEELSGMILLGTGSQPLWMILAGEAAVFVIRKMKGDRYRSLFLHRMVLGSYNRFFKPSKTEHDWLSRDEAQVRAYIEDPCCCFHFTSLAYRDFLKIMRELKAKRGFSHIPSKLPILILSGGLDPVGEFQKGVHKVYREFQKRGAEDLTMHLYDGCRHELLHELNRGEVFEDIKRWIDCRVPGRMAQTGGILHGKAETD